MAAAGRILRLAADPWVGFFALVLMIVEKLPIGRRLTAPVGIVLIAAAGSMAATNLPLR